MKITEITRQGAELDTTAKIQVNIPNWKLVFLTLNRLQEAEVQLLVEQDDSNEDP